jgi:ApeA N-terminal domain 1
MNFPCQGHWWLPGSPDKSIFGTLTFTRREGATLSLADVLPGTGDEPQTDVVLGQTAGGAHVTLLHAIRTAAPLLRLTPAFPCSYHAPLLITGGAFESQADMRFSLFQIRFRTEELYRPALFRRSGSI